MIFKNQKSVPNSPLRTFIKSGNGLMNGVKDATIQERIDEIRRQAEPGIRAIEKLKAERNNIQ
jgi:hypothetical protein